MFLFDDNSVHQSWSSPIKRLGDLRNPWVRDAACRAAGPATRAFPPVPMAVISAAGAILKFPRDAASRFVRIGAWRNGGCVPIPAICVKKY